MVDLPIPVTRTKASLLQAFAGGQPQQLNERDWIETMFARIGAPTFETLTTVGQSKQEPAPDVIRTLGYATVGDGGGAYYAKVSSAPAPLTAGVNWHRVQDGSQNWYETLSKNHVLGQEAGIFGENTNVTANLNSLIEYMVRNGGGTIELPEGIVRADTQVIVNGNGVHVRGIKSGRGFGGTILHTLWTSAGPKILIGGGATRRESVSFTAMHIHAGGHESPVFGLRGITNCWFNDLTYDNAWELFECGDPSVADAFANEVYIEDVVGNMGETHRSALSMPNLAGGLHCQDFHAEGLASPFAGSAGILLPTTALLRPDGVYLTTCGFGLFDRGMDLQFGGANWISEGVLLDRIKGCGLFVNLTAVFHSFHFVNGHINGLSSGPVSGALGIYTEAASGTEMYDWVIALNHINYWGSSGAYLHSGNVAFIDNFVTDTCGFADNTNDAIRTGAAFDGKICGNRVSKIQAANDPRYGIEIESTSALIRVQDNDIYAGQTGLIHNTNRGSLQTRRVTGNTGQTFEGRQAAFDGWHTPVDVPATATTTFYIADNTALAYIRMERRGRIVEVGAVSSGAIVSGTATIGVYFFGGAVQLAVALSSGIASDSNIDLDGVPFNAGQVLELKVVSASLNPTTLEFLAWFIVEWD